ncbi:MAG: ParA family protein [Phycisphaerae bacterium]
MRTIAVINQKGGVGKTTTVVNLGAALAEAGRRVCLLDMDPQSHLTLHLGIEPGNGQRSMYDLLTDEVAVPDAAVMVAERLHLVPADIDLAAAEVELVGTVGREQILRDRLATADLPYDLVMIDCPPSLGLLTLNALAAADDVLIPLQPHFLALQGLGKLLETVALVQKRINPRLKVLGVVLCMYESTARLTGEVVADLRGFLDASRSGESPWSQARIFESVIRRNVKLAECPSYGKTIFKYEPSSNGAADYARLATEFLSQLNGAAPVEGPANPAEATAPRETPAAEELPTHSESAEPANATHSIAPPSSHSADASPPHSDPDPS